MCTRIKCHKCNCGLIEGQILSRGDSKAMLLCPKCLTAYEPWFNWDCPKVNNIINRIITSYDTAKISSQMNRICRTLDADELLDNRNNFINRNGWW